MPCSTENLPSEWLVLQLMVETHRKADPGLGEGVSNRLLEHQFKPSPSGRTLSFGCFAYFISYILQVPLFDNPRRAKDPSSEPLSLPGDCGEERDSVRSPHTFFVPFLGWWERACCTYVQVSPPEFSKDSAFEEPQENAKEKVRAAALIVLSFASAEPRISFPFDCIEIDRRKIN